MIRVVAFDGDDTLWHNEPLFWATTEYVAQALAPYADAEHLAQRIYATEVRNLSLFGYGIKGFVLSLIETAIQVSDGRVPVAVIQEFIERGKQMLAHPVHLLDHVEKTLRAVRHAGWATMLITKGDLIDQEGKLARSGLAPLFDHVRIVSEKDCRTYQEAFAPFGGPEAAVMVGNSVRSDILPMLEAGGHAVLVPYPNQWAHEHAEEPAGHERFHRAEGMMAVMDVLRGI